MAKRAPNSTPVQPNAPGAFISAQDMAQSHTIQSQTFPNVRPATATRLRVNRVKPFFMPRSLPGTAEESQRGGLVRMLNQTSEPIVFNLPAILDMKVSASLRLELLKARGRALRLDASQVERLSAPCLQVLLSAQATWAKDGQTLELGDQSTQFSDQLSAFGAPDLCVPPMEHGR